MGIFWIFKYYDEVKLGKIRCYNITRNIIIYAITLLNSGLRGPDLPRRVCSVP